MRRPGRKAVAAGAMGARRAGRGWPLWSSREGLRAGTARACHLGCHGALGPGPPGQVPAVLDGRLNRASVAARDGHARHAGTDRAVDHRQRVPVGVRLAGAVELDRSGGDAGCRAATAARADRDAVALQAGGAVGIDRGRVRAAGVGQNWRAGTRAAVLLRGGELAGQRRRGARGPPGERGRRARSEQDRPRPRQPRRRSAPAPPERSGRARDASRP